MKYTSRADLLIAAGESIKMQENAGINPWFKYDGIKFLMTECQTQFIDPQRYEFPIAVVECKPVFVGDVLWNIPNNFYFTVARTSNINYLTCLWNDGKNGVIGGCVSDMSWNPPKSKTVMVELLIESVEYFATGNGASESLKMACRKALETK